MPTKFRTNGNKLRKRINNPFTGVKKRRAWNKNVKQTINDERKVKLAESDRGSYYKQEEWIEKYLTAGSSLRNCTYQDDLENSSSSSSCDSDSDYSDSNDSGDEENIEQNEKESRISDTYSIVSKFILQELLTDKAACKLCCGNLTIYDRYPSRSHGLGSVWSLICCNESCKNSTNINPVPMTPKKSKTFEINRQFVLAFRAIGRGYSAAAKFTSIMNLNKPISKNSWPHHTKAISEKTEILLEKNLQQESLNLKIYLREIGKIEDISDAELKDKNVEIAASVDGSWKTRGWSSTAGIVDICSDLTGKVLDVIYKNTKCVQCSKMKEKKRNGVVTEIDYLQWYVNHDDECLSNHEGSASVSLQIVSY